MKKRITTFNVAVAQLTSTLMLPIIWVLVGSISQWLLNGTGIFTEKITQPVYYLILIVSYYFGLKYSFLYVSKHLIVTQPKKSAAISSFLFSLGLLTIYLAFYSYSGEHVFYRVVTFFILAYMFVTMTKKYFDSLESDNTMNEYNLVSQIGFTIVNLSLIVMLAILTIWLIKDYPWTQGLYYAVLIAWMGDYGSKINDFLFIPYFYKEKTVVPYKKAIVSLSVTLPVNIFLFYMIDAGALS